MKPLAAAVVLLAINLRSVLAGLPRANAAFAIAQRVLEEG